MKPKDISGDLPRHSKKKPSTRRLREIKWIVLHNTDDNNPTPNGLALYDIGPNHISQTGCPSITYNELIMSDGTPYLTLYYDEIGWHCGAWNRDAIGIAMNYKSSNDKGEDEFGPPEKCLKAAIERCGELCLYFCFSPSKIYGHRELPLVATGKTCPGLQVNLDTFRTEVAKYMQIVLEEKGLYDGGIDGIFGPLSEYALTQYPRNYVL